MSDGATDSAGSGKAELPASLQEKLKTLINKHKVMVFMKGAKANPRCKFSKELVEILNQQGVEFDAFDIFTDEEVWDGLKIYSNWPTYPQVYVNGSLVGGVDIIKELKEDGSLKATLCP